MCFYEEITDKKYIPMDKRRFMTVEDDGARMFYSYVKDMIDKRPYLFIDNICF